MRQIVIVAGSALLVLSGPALAKDHGRGHGYDQHDGWRGGADRDERYAERGYRHCPPGLAKKHNGCLPPGQARSGYDYDREGYRDARRRDPIGEAIRSILH